MPKEVIEYEIVINPASLKKAIADAAKVSNVAKQQAAQIKAQDRADQVATKAKMSLIKAEEVRQKQALIHTNKLAKAQLGTFSVIDAKQKESIKTQAKLELEAARAKNKLELENIKAQAKLAKSEAQKIKQITGGKGSSYSNKGGTYNFGKFGIGSSSSRGLLGNSGSSKTGMFQGLIAGIGLGYAAKQFSSRISSGVSGIKSSIGNGLVGNVSGSMKGLVSGAGGFGGAIAGGAGSIVGGIGGGILGGGLGAIGGLSGIVSGGIAGAGAGVAGGALLGKAVEGLANEVNKVIDILDSMVQEFAKFDPALAKMVAIFQAQTIQFDITLARITEPITTAWMQVKSDFLGALLGIAKAATPLIDIFTKAVDSVDDFINKIASFFGINTKDQFNVAGLPNQATGFGMTGSVTQNPTVSFQDGIQKTWDYLKQKGLEFFDWLKLKLSEIFDWLKPKIEQWWNDLVSWLQPKISSFIDFLQNQFINFFTILVPKVIDAVTTAIGNSFSGAHITAGPNGGQIYGPPAQIQKPGNEEGFQKLNNLFGSVKDSQSYKDLTGPNSIFGGAKLPDTIVAPPNRPSRMPWLGPLNLLRGAPTGNDPDEFGKAQSRNYELNTDVGATAMLGGQDWGNFSSPPASTKDNGAFLPQIQGGINQTITNNLNAQITNKQGVKEAIMQVQDKLMAALFTARNEAKLMSGIVLGHGDALGM